MKKSSERCRSLCHLLTSVKIRSKLPRVEDVTEKGKAPYRIHMRGDDYFLFVITLPRLVSFPSAGSFLPYITPSLVLIPHPLSICTPCLFTRTPSTQH